MATPEGKLLSLVREIILEHGNGFDVEFEWNPATGGGIQQVYQDGVYRNVPVQTTPTLKRVKVRWVDEDAL